MSNKCLSKTPPTGEPPAKRRRRRNKVEAKTFMCVPTEVWLVVCKNTFFSPHTPFRLMMASKSLWIILRDDKEWWKAFYDRVMQYQSILQTSRFYNSLVSFSRKEKCYRTVLKLVFSPRCSSCGVRFGHRVFRPLMQRLCNTCVRDQLVSNKVLYYRYGINFADFLLEYLDKGGFVLQCEFSKPNVGALAAYTTETMDVAGRQTIPKGRWLNSVLFFFKRSDIEGLMGINLFDSAIRARQRDGAVRALQAIMERKLLARRVGGGLIRTQGDLCVRTGTEGGLRVATNWFACTAPGQEYCPRSLVHLREASELSDGEFLRRRGLTLRSIARTAWLEGGAFYAVVNPDQSNRLLLHRPGFASDQSLVFSEGVQKRTHHVRA